MFILHSLGSKLEFESDSNLFFRQSDFLIVLNLFFFFENILLQRASKIIALASVIVNNVLFKTRTFSALFSRLRVLVLL